MIKKMSNGLHAINYEASHSTQLQTNTTTDSISNKTYYDDNNDELKKKLMDKDKTIIDHLKKIKEKDQKNKTLSKIKDDLAEKTKAMENEINDMSIQIKSKDNTIYNLKEEIQMIKAQSESQIIQQKNDISKLTKTIDELKNKARLNEDLINKWVEENRKVQSIINCKEQIIEEKKNLIEENDNIIQQLRNDNKQLLSLKRQLNEYEDIIKNNKKEINIIQSQYEIITKEKERIECDLIQKNQIKLVKNEDIIDNNNTFENKRLQKENESLLIQNAELLSKYKMTSSDFDSFANNIIVQIGKMTKDIETDMNLKNISHKTIIKNETVEDVIKNSLFLLNQSILSKFESSEQNIDKLIKINKEQEEINQNLKNEKTYLVKSNTLLTAQNSQYINEYNEQSKTLNQLSKNYMNLQNSYVSLKETYQKITQEIEMIGKQTQSFLNSLIDKLFPEKQNDNCHYSISNKIYQGLDALIKSNKQLLYKINLIENSNIILSKEQYHNLITENETLKKENINNQQTTENIKLQSKKKEEDAIIKVKELSYLLEENNQLVIDYDNQLKDTKERNKKLENNLEMLTKSHYELEHTITSNDSKIKEEYNLLQNKYYGLLREIELKDLHIQSLEKLQLSERKILNKPFIGKLLMKAKENNGYYNAIMPENKIYQSNNIFVLNDEKEKELKKMFIESSGSQGNNSQANICNYPDSQMAKLKSNKTKSL